MAVVFGLDCCDDRVDDHEPRLALTHEPRQVLRVGREPQRLVAVTDDELMHMGQVALAASTRGRITSAAGSSSETKITSAGLLSFLLDT